MYPHRNVTICPLCDYPNRGEIADEIRTRTTPGHEHIPVSQSNRTDYQWQCAGCKQWITAEDEAENENR